MAHFGLPPEEVNWWPLIEEQLSAALQELFDQLRIMAEEEPAGLIEELRQRYEAGRREHMEVRRRAGRKGRRGEPESHWSRWPRERFVLEAREEDLDRWLYPAMRRVIYGD